MVDNSEINNSEIEELRNELRQSKELLNQINVKVTNIEELEESEIKHILNVKNMESEEIGVLDDIKTLENSEIKTINKLSPKRFNNVTSWKSRVWDGCSSKIMNDSKKLVTFSCKLSGKACSFDICPKNIIPNENKTKE
jgi:hypothetical protein